MPTESAMPREGVEAQLLDLFLFLGSEWILYLLLILSIISIGITFERIVHFFKRRVDLDRMRVSLDKHLRAGEIESARTLLKASKSHVAVIVLAGLEALGRGAASMEEIVAGVTQLERLKMERGLAFLGTLGNNAPFIGLFGTVLGIVRSFRDLSTNTIEGTSAVMAGIAEALIATAVGLLVALPAVAVFNLFQRTVRKQVAASDAMARILLAHAKENRE
ncbi:MAG: MotA/TolQ/ExbB proton channel family protein [Myxococcota bacterium]